MNEKHDEEGVNPLLVIENEDDEGQTAAPSLKRVKNTTRRGKPLLIVENECKTRRGGGKPLLVIENEDDEGQTAASSLKNTIRRGKPLLIVENE